VPTAISAMFGVVPKPPDELKDIASLEVYLGVSNLELQVIKKHRSKMYSRFAIPKRSGGNRIIEAPNKRLLFLQRKLLEIFVRLYKPRKPVHGFVPQRSAITNAREHIGRQYIVNVDLKDFFPTISQQRVLGLLLTLGIPQPVAECIVGICCVGNHLPQGAPTSPILSNMISLRLDRRIMQFCKARRIKYSRYADDFTFSSYTRPKELFRTEVPVPGKVKSDQLSEELTSIFIDNGFTVNEEKIRYFGSSSRKEVTGLVVSEILNVPRRFVRNIRAIIFDIEKNGYSAAQIRFSRKTKSITSLAQHLRGRINWLSQVKGFDDGVYLSIAKRYNRLSLTSPLRLGHSKGEVRDLANWVLEVDGAKISKMSQGSAFFLQGFGLITAEHCVQGAGVIEVFHPHKPANRYPVTVAKSCKHRDLAILSHNIPKEEFLELVLADQLVRTGDKVKVLGYPSFGPGSNLQVRDARIVGHQNKSAVKQIIVDAKINQGNSGGPVVNHLDHVVGVCHKGGLNEAMDIAIAIQEVKLL
jgi:RNA-directed DNA polymerase